MPTDKGLLDAIGKSKEQLAIVGDEVRKTLSTRDDLLATLQEIAEYRSSEETADADMVSRIIELAEKAIAEAKGD